MQRIDFVLNSTLKKFNYDVKLKEFHVLNLWDEVVGELIAGHAQPENIKRGKLFVKVSNPAWLPELESMKRKIIERLNTEVRSKTIRDIHFSLSEFSKPNHPAPESQHREWVDIDIDEGDLEGIKRSLVTIKDPRIRESFHRIMTKDAKLRKFRED